MSSPKITRTTNPLHFEDLDPHRFEDLIRQLAYDIRDWYKIEATGRGGSDEGIDIRAWEKASTIHNDDEDPSGNQGEIIVEGNLWVIQCKREQRLGPSQIRKIVSSLKDNSQIYGYIIAAPANFSKKAYDTFRAEIRKKSIVECYLWGRAELEDMLLLPKNDRILFTFFGLSLSTRRRSRTIEVRFKVNNKNKLFRIFGHYSANQEFHSPILLRDLHDKKYPWDEEYPDFQSRPRWFEAIAYAFHPRGLCVHLRQYHAFFDMLRNKFDYTQEVDILPGVSRHNVHDETRNDRLEAVGQFMRYISRVCRAHLYVDGIIAWEDILFVDDKGDTEYECPHLFIDTRDGSSLVSSTFHVLQRGRHQLLIADEHVRIKMFPKKCPPASQISVSRSRDIQVNDFLKSWFEEHHPNECLIFDAEGTYANLTVKDILRVSNVSVRQGQLFLEVIHMYTTTVADFLRQPDYSSYRKRIEDDVGRTVKDDERITVLECERVMEWQIERSDLNSGE